MSGGGAALMSCVREGSLEPPVPYRPPHIDSTRHGEGRTGRFLRGLRRMFKRRGSGTRVDHSPDPKSSSTSELLDADRAARRKEGAYSSGLSVSHDSVFTGERSGDESSEERPPPAHGGPHLTFSHRAELVAAVRRRGRGDGSDDDEDLGLPRSPPASPPTDKADKRHHAGISQSSCSDGSLLSVGSSEMDEDSSSGHHHDHSGRSEHSDLYNSSEPPTGVAPLSHSAAKHKMAVRPRRKHGAPRRNKNNHLAASALPITPELNEEMIRSTTPEVTHFKSTEVVTESFSSSTTTKHHVVKENQQQLNKELQRVIETPSDTKLKSSSLPPGLALSQLGQTPTKLTIAEHSTPRSSIKRSRSSTQGKSLQDEQQLTQGSTSESQIYHEEKVNRYYKTETKYAEDSCLIDKKSKSEKKEERTKKEESFFSRLLLRKSGKKSKKEATDQENYENKKIKPEKLTSHYKPVDTERTEFCHSNLAPNKPEKPFKSAAQRVIASQAHKRNENKNINNQENEYKDIYSAVKVTGVEYNITDLKVAEETDKMLNREMKNRFSRQDNFLEKIENPKRTSSKETIEEVHKQESFNLHGHDRTKRPPTSVQRLVDPYVSKPFIGNERIDGMEEEMLRAPRIQSVQNEYSFNSGSMPKNILYFNPKIVISASASPPKSILHHRSSEHVSEYSRERHESKHMFRKTDDSFNNHTALRSLGEEYVESRGSIGKSHSFRYASETSSISSQETQLPSLPAIVGISEPLLQSWEVNYRRNVNHHTSESFSGRHNYANRVSARNYGVMPATDNNYDSLQSTDSSYLDSLKTETTADDRQLFNNAIQIPVEPKRNSDISQIEAKIDDIISSPKPIIASILKSSSLDSVKSTPEKQADERRKTISVEYSLDLCKDIVQSDKPESDTYISITHINREPTPVKNTEPPKINKSDEKLQKITSDKPKLPEFLQIQLNRVDSKPATNVVLTANLTPKKEIQTDREQDIEKIQISENKIPKQTQVKRDLVLGKFVENTNETVQNDEKSPIIGQKTVLTPTTPQSPSKAFFKRKTASTESQEKHEKSRNNSVSTEGSTERIFDNISIDQKSHSSFGSKSSIQSTDSYEPKTPDRHEETVVYRKKPVTLAKERSSKRNDDEPELLKVFARRSLKIKDSEAESIAQEIAQAQNSKQETEHANSTKTKLLKNEFNASIKSRDSDKENDESTNKEKADEKRLVDIAARVSQFGMPHYQRSVSINSVATVNIKRESMPITKNDVNKYKKEVSDSTPEKRLRNRTFPDPSNDRDDIKNITKSEAMAYKADTLTKKPWKRDDEKKVKPDRVERANSSPVIEENNDNVFVEKEKENNEEADGSPQFKGILHMKAEWERRAKQGMTK